MVKREGEAHAAVGLLHVEHAGVESASWPRCRGRRCRSARGWAGSSGPWCLRFGSGAQHDLAERAALVEQFVRAARLRPAGSALACGARTWPAAISAMACSIRPRRCARSASTAWIEKVRTARLRPSSWRSVSNTSRAGRARARCCTTPAMPNGASARRQADEQRAAQVVEGQVDAAPAGLRHHLFGDAARGRRRPARPTPFSSAKARFSCVEAVPITLQAAVRAPPAPAPWPRRRPRPAPGWPAPACCRCCASSAMRQLEVAQADRVVEGDAVGQHERRVGRHADVLGIAAAALRQFARAHQHALADRQAGHARRPPHRPRRPSRCPGWPAAAASTCSCRCGSARRARRHRWPRALHAHLAGAGLGQRQLDQCPAPRARPGTCSCTAFMVSSAQRCPSCTATLSCVRPPRRECTRPPVPITSANRISSGRGASWMPISMLL